MTPLLPLLILYDESTSFVTKEGLLTVLRKANNIANTNIDALYRHGKNISYRIEIKNNKN